MYKCIVVGTDGSATAGRAVEQAAGLAKSFGAELHLVSAYRVPGAAAMASVVSEAGAALVDPDWQMAAQAEVERTLGGMVGRLKDQGVSAVPHVRPGDPVAAIIDVAGSTKADLVVVGNKGMKGARRVLGSVPNSVAHKAPCSVLIVETT